MRDRWAKAMSKTAARKIAAAIARLHRRKRKREERIERNAIKQQKLYKKAIRRRRKRWGILGLKYFGASDWPAHGKYDHETNRFIEQPERLLALRDIPRPLLELAKLHSELIQAIRKKRA